jgi:plastocyanin
MFSLATPVAAGGWATVELDEPLGKVEAGTPITIGFMVMQHGVTPFGDAEPVLTAVHRESGEKLSVDGKAEGVEGHYVAAVTFPSEGTWSWSIAPAPFPGSTSFPAVTVVAAGQLGDASAPEQVGIHGAAVIRHCGATNVPMFGLSDLDLSGDTKPGAPEVERSESVLPISVHELVAAGAAISIGEQAGGTQDALACGPVLGEPVDGELIVGLAEANDSGYVGFARLTEDGGQTTVDVYLMSGLVQTGPVAEVVMSGAMFSPSHLEIAVGTTVTWTNTDPIKHEVAFDDPELDDSGLLVMDDSFSLTFDTPGTYTYYCGPHPGMTGTVVVS